MTIKQGAFAVPALSKVPIELANHEVHKSTRWTVVEPPREYWKPSPGRMEFVLFGTPHATRVKMRAHTSYNTRQIENLAGGVRGGNIIRASAAGASFD